MRVLVFGASITQGFWDAEGGWVARLRKHYDEQRIANQSDRDIPTFFNLGISGDTSKDLRKRFVAETEARVWPDEEMLFIFCIGTNNARTVTGKLMSSSALYREDMLEVVNKARNYSSKLMMVGIPCCDEKLTTPVGWDAKTSYTNAAIKAIDNAMKNICQQQSIPYVPTFDTFVEQIAKGTDLLTDGLHPNNDGHQLMFELMLPTLQKLAA